MQYYYSTRRRDPNAPHYGLTEVTPPSVEPVSLTEAKTQLRQDITDDDTMITTLIVAARKMAERWTGRRFITQTWDLTLDDFPIGSREIIIPYGPVQSITSVTYVDSGGTTQTYSAANYTLDTATFAPRLYPIYSLIWPITRYQRNSVTVRYVAGYGPTSASCPENFVHAVKMLISYLYENRGDKAAEMPPAIAAMLNMERESWL